MKSSKKWVKSVPSLEQTPLNVTQDERTKSFKDSFASFKVLQLDSMSGQFLEKVKPFFKPCNLRFSMTWISRIESFGSRKRISIESVFKLNPASCLLIISGTMDSEAREQMLLPFKSRGFRVMAEAPDLRSVFKKTPAEEFKIIQPIAFYPWTGLEFTVILRVRVTRNMLSREMPRLGIWKRKVVRSICGTSKAEG